ncbi:hypothetical protein C8R43DRAFT_848102, partial [Mycena crocata]
TPVQPTESAPSSTLLFDDLEAEKNSFTANDDSIPLAIFSLAKNRISPPLTLFLPASLERIRLSNIKTVKHSTGESVRVTVIDIAEFPDEDTLEQARWFPTYNIFLSFIQSSSGVRIYEGFAHHLNLIMPDPDLSTWFTAYRAFDKKIRAQFFTKPYIIDIQNAEYRTALQNAKNSFLHSMQSSSASASAPGSSSSRGGSGSGSHGKDKFVERTKPYDRNDKDERKRSTLCFRCGRIGHGASSCDEKSPSRHGREFVVYAERNGIYRIFDNRPVCMRFNTGKCDSTARPHNIHICSLCSDSHHGAVDCARN